MIDPISGGPVSGAPPPALRHDEGAPCFLVLVGDPLVGLDLAQTLAERDARARVLFPANEAEAMAALEGVARVAVAFLDLDPAALPRSALAAAVVARGGRIVLMGGAAERARRGPGWWLLDRPFTTEDVVELLAFLTRLKD